MTEISARQVEERLLKFQREFFDKPSENRFVDSIEQGLQALPGLVEVLGCEDAERRTEALLAIGKIFDVFGCDSETLKTLVAHSKTLGDKRLGPEHQATLFALGRSADPELIEAFVPLLSSEDTGAVNTALFLLGYARWRDAVPFVKFLITQNNREVLPTALWAIGQIGREDCLDLLLPMVRRGEHLEWVVGAVGNFGSTAALEDLASILEHERPDIRALTATAIWTIIEKQAKLRARDFVWMNPVLQKASGDSYAPVAVFSMMTLAKLGFQIDETKLEKALVE